MKGKETAPAPLIPNEVVNQGLDAIENFAVQRKLPAKAYREFLTDRRITRDNPSHEGDLTGKQGKYNIPCRPSLGYTNPAKDEEAVTTESLHPDK